MTQRKPDALTSRGAEEGGHLHLRVGAVGGGSALGISRTLGGGRSKVQFVVWLVLPGALDLGFLLLHLYFGSALSRSDGEKTLGPITVGGCAF